MYIYIYMYIYICIYMYIYIYVYIYMYIYIYSILCIYININMDGWLIIYIYILYISIYICKWGMIRFYSTGYIIIYIFILWNQHPGTKRKKTWMKDATCRSSMRSLQKGKRMYHGPKNWGHKFGSWATNYNIVAIFLGSESGPYSIRAASVLLPPQADSSTYPWYSEGTCPRSLLYHLFEAGLGALGPPRLWEKAPPMLEEKPTKTWGTNRNGLDVKL